MKTTSITLDNIKDENWAQVYSDLGYSHEEGRCIFEYGEYGSITIDIDENLNITGGFINRFKPEEKIKYYTLQNSSREVKEFIYEDQQEVIHVIKTGFEDKYIVVHEDCHEVILGTTYVGSKEEVENKYKIKL